MAHKRRRRGQDRGRLGFIFTMLVFIAVLLVVSLSAGLFFKVTGIEVEGANVVYADAVKQASGIEEGENLIFINKNSAGRAILEELPYVEEIRIRRKLPDTVVIEIMEAKPLCVMEHMGLYWKISGAGKLLESASFFGDATCPVVAGASLVAPVAGTRIAFSTDEKDKERILLDILGAMEGEDMLADVSEIDLSKNFEIHFQYLGRFDVILGMAVDIPYKLSFLKLVVARLETGSRGKLDLSAAQDAIVHFVPSE